jgi:hypothetical protein
MSVKKEFVINALKSSNLTQKHGHIAMNVSLLTGKIDLKI